jgi:hypothetical protein
MSRKRLTSLSFWVLFLAAGMTALSCDDGPPPRPPTTPVADLPASEAQALCESFFAAACTMILDPNDSACTTCDPCGNWAVIGRLCGDGITVGAVRHCMDSGFDMPTCTGPERGGCMFDVADVSCTLPASP